MNKNKSINRPTSFLRHLLFITPFLGLSAAAVNAEVTLETQVKITDSALHFDGKKLTYGTLDQADTSEQYDFFFGRNISAHGDAVKSYKNYVFMTWYRGGKDDRHVMLTRYNKDTGTLKTIEFPHRHTGFRGDPNIGESHNTIAVAISPINGTIHLLYDMHAYDNNNHGGKFQDDYFRYSYSVPGAADEADDDFTLSQFVRDTSAVSQGPDDYKHLTMTGNLSDKGNFVRLTYPKFFTTEDGTLLLYMRLGGNNNGAYVYNRYDANAQAWSTFTQFNHKDQKSKGNEYNWGLYGNMKYVNGKFRIGFQQRANKSDKYLYQNGVYYAYSDHPQAVGDWKNHNGEPITSPLLNSDEIKVFEPGDYISHTETDSVRIVDDFDWTVTEKGDIHIISKVESADKSRPDYQLVYLHSYKPAGASEFIITTDFAGASEIYTAADDIYIVGLDNGYPFVEKAKGGTNEFTRVYQATEGTQFDHGTIYIEDGKIYYYLMEKGTGNAQPLHLQIIDLDIDNPEDALKPVVTFPQSYLTVDEGYDQLSFHVDAYSPDSDRAVTGVKLFANGNFIREDTAAPYVWGHKNKPTELLGLPPGTNTFRAVATDDLGREGAATMILNVVGEAKATVEFPHEKLTAYEGYSQLSFKVFVTSASSDVPVTGVKLYANDRFIREDSADPYVWGHKNKPTELLGLPVGNHVFRAVAQDAAGLTAEATMDFEVRERVYPTVSFAQAYMLKTVGYDSLVLDIDASNDAEDIDIAKVELFIDGMLIRTETAAPYVWGDSNSTELLGLPLGEHILSAVATDSIGSQAFAEMVVDVKPAIVAVDSESESYLASNLVDGDIGDSSAWSPAQNGTKEVVIDLGERKTILGTKTWTTGGDEIKYQVYVSDYPESGFVKVAKHQNKHDDAQPTQTAFSAQGRYVKLMAIGNWPSINEFEVITE